jgi:hypothetical protein
MPFCGECGVDAGTSKFCGECGSPVAGNASAAAAAPAAAAAAAPAPDKILIGKVPGSGPKPDASSIAKVGWQPKGADFGMAKMSMTDAVRDSTGKALTESSTSSQTKRFGGEFTTNLQQTRGISLQQSLAEIDDAVANGVRGVDTKTLYTPAQDADFGGGTVNGVGSSGQLNAKMGFGRGDNKFGQQYGAAHQSQPLGANDPGGKLGGHTANHGFGSAAAAPDKSGGAASAGIMGAMMKNKGAKKQVSLTD